MYLFNLFINETLIRFIAVANQQTAQPDDNGW